MSILCGISTCKREWYEPRFNIGISLQCYMWIYNAMSMASPIKKKPKIILKKNWINYYDLPDHCIIFYILFSKYYRKH